MLETAPALGKLESRRSAIQSVTTPNSFRVARTASNPSETIRRVQAPQRIFEYIELFYNG
jgi:hypothetical protein